MTPFPPATDQRLALSRDHATTAVHEAAEHLPDHAPELVTALVAVQLLAVAADPHDLAWVAASLAVRCAQAAYDQAPVEPILARLHDSLYEGLPAEDEPIPYQLADGGCE